MKTEGQIRQQLKQVVFRHLQKKLKALFRRIPESCFHNEATGKIGFCGVQSSDPKGFVVICDIAVEGGLEKAKTCPLWKARRTKAEVKQDFKALMMSGDKGRIAAEYPDVAALLWVLGDREGLEQDIDAGIDGRLFDSVPDETSVLEELSGSDDGKGDGL